MEIQLQTLTELQKFFSLFQEFKPAESSFTGHKYSYASQQAASVNKTLICRYSSSINILLVSYKALLSKCVMIQRPPYGYQMKFYMLSQMAECHLFWSLAVAVVTDNECQPGWLHLHHRQITCCSLRWRIANVHQRKIKPQKKVNTYNTNLSKKHKSELNHILACYLYNLQRCQMLPRHVATVSYWPAWTERGFSSRKTVCFQWVFVTWGPVENITWSGNAWKGRKNKDNSNQCY